MSTIYIRIPPEIRPALGQRSLWRLEGRSIALFNVDGTLYAIDDSCPHAGASLLSGIVEGRTVRCRAHGLRFALTDGCMPGGLGFGVRSYAIEMLADQPFLVLVAAETASEACAPHASRCG